MEYPEVNADSAHGAAGTDELLRLLVILPVPLQKVLQTHPLEELLEIVMDLGRPPQARFAGRAATLSDVPVTQSDLDHVLALTGRFSADNRAGIERTLHRISAIRNRRGEVVGLTLRVGRAVYGTIDLLRDIIESGANVLLVGRPGVGKTTKLREVARVLADDLGKRVMVVDTSNEIGGDGDVPHPAIGSARRMQVTHPDNQHGVMIEAVENHMPEAIIVDEIGTSPEAAAARTIAERGVQLIATAHGNTLENLVLNPVLSDLVGGVQTVTLGDEEARLRGTQKTISERKGPPTFDVVVEIADRDEVIVHRNTAAAVDELLRGVIPGGERRRRGEAGALEIETASPHSPAPPREAESGTAGEGTTRIYPYALSRDSVDRVIRDLRLDARTVGRPEQATMVLALRSRTGDQRLQRILQVTGLPMHLIKKNTTAQIRHLLQELFHLFAGMDDFEAREALQEAEAAIRQVMREGGKVDLAPRRSALRRLQHKLVVRHRLVAESSGSEPQRHLTIFPA